MSTIFKEGVIVSWSWVLIKLLFVLDKIKYESFGDTLKSAFLTLVSFTSIKIILSLVPHVYFHDYFNRLSTKYTDALSLKKTWQP